MVSLAGTGRHRRLADSDSDSEEPSNVLTTAKASELCPKPYRLIARNQSLTALDDLSALSVLDYIDVSRNKLSSLSGLEGNKRLKTLIAKGNNLKDVDAILNIEALRVLDVSDNGLTSTEWLLRAAFASELVALVIGGNELRILECISCLQSVQTIVISHNHVEDLAPLVQLRTLKKLSAAHNSIRKLPEKLSGWHSLVELRLAHNRIMGLQGVEKLPALRILDVGNNRIETFSALKGCYGLVQVNLRDNPACLKGGVEFVKQVCVGLEIVDGVRIKGGRRKVRVNRIRVQAGFQVEKDRNFARLPPGYSEEGKGGERERTLKGSDDLKESAVRKRKRTEGDNENEVSKTQEGEQEEPRGEPVKGAQGAAGMEESEDDALNAENFVRMAKANSLSERKELAKAPTKDGRGRRQRKKRRQEAGAVFGEGGSTKW